MAHIMNKFGTSLQINQFRQIDHSSCVAQLQIDHSRKLEKWVYSLTGLVSKIGETQWLRIPKLAMYLEILYFKYSIFLNIPIKVVDYY